MSSELEIWFYKIKYSTEYLYSISKYHFPESPAQSVSSGVRAPSPAPSSVPLGSEKPSNVSQDRKVPVPIGTERSARIRQTGTSAPSVIGSNLSTSVGHSGIWSFEGIGGNQGMIYCHITGR